MPIIDIDKQISFYDTRWKAVAKRPYLQQHLKNRIYGIRRMLERIQVSEPQILEIGCGLGHISNELSRFGSVEAIDLSLEAVRIARKLYPHVKFSRGDVFEYDFSNSTYDIIVSSEVIEHVSIENRNSFVRILSERLKPNGWLILTTPNREVSDKLTKGQAIENHFSQNEIRDLLAPYFTIKNFVTVQNFFPVLCSRSRFFQIIRIFLYEVLSLRNFLEDPFKCKNNGLYFVILAQRKEQQGIEILLSNAHPTANPATERINSGRTDID
ncbi:MAG: class I SAM-dependent methyltransferase [Candidatus Hodarchaeota archaeon]